MPLRALARVNLAAVQRNVSRLLGDLRGDAVICAVVKAGGYGHGAVPVAQAAIAGGAAWLAVATAQEAAELRAGGLTDVPILVMGAISKDELPVALAAGADLVAWSEEFLDEVAAAGAAGRVRLHVKFDSGMGRLGTRDRDEALLVAARISSDERRFELVGAMTHFATADEDQQFVREQLERALPWIDELRRRHPGLVVHAANSAATLNNPETHFDMVRCGIAIYGGDPMQADASARRLEPALELTSYVAAVKLAGAGESAGYGRRFVATRDTWLATLPIGYADGIRRGLTNNCDVLIGGRRYPLVGTVSMDNITVDLGPEPVAHVGELGTIIGTDGSESQTTEDLARRLRTINYENTCGISARVPRHYHRDGRPV
jgi:alanine racemase